MKGHVTKFGKLGYVKNGKFNGLREAIKDSGHEMTLERALNIVGYFSVRKGSGEVTLKVGEVTSRHKNAKEAYQTLEEVAQRTERISTEEFPPEWYRILFNAGFSPVKAVRVYDLSQALELRHVVASYLDYVYYFAQVCHEKSTL